MRRGRLISIGRYRQQLTPYAISISVCCLIAVLVFFGIRLFLFDDDAVVIEVVPATGPDPVRVQVVGAVASPGVYELPAGSTIRDAVDAAGGPTGGIKLEEQAAVASVQDGQLVVVPADEHSGSPTGGPIDINTATAAELESLPGIGPVIAGRVVQYRELNGPFASVDELAAVSGISERMVDEMRSQIFVASE